MRAQKGVFGNDSHPPFYPKFSVFLQEAFQSLKEQLSSLAIQSKGAPPTLPPLTHCPCSPFPNHSKESTARSLQFQARHPVNPHPQNFLLAHGP